MSGDSKNRITSVDGGSLWRTLYSKSVGVVATTLNEAPVLNTASGDIISFAVTMTGDK